MKRARLRIHEPITDPFYNRHGLHVLLSVLINRRRMIWGMAAGQNAVALKLGMSQRCRSCDKLICDCSDEAYLGNPMARLALRDDTARLVTPLNDDDYRAAIDTVPLEARCKSCLLSACLCPDHEWLGLAIPAGVDPATVLPKPKATQQAGAPA